MKKNSNTLFPQLSLEEKLSLTETVKETLAEGFMPANKKVFTDAELWNIQRQRKAIVQRRFLF